MTPNYMSVCVKLLLKLTVIFMSVLSTSCTTQCKKTEKDISVIRNVGIKLCQLKCVENGQCLSIGYNSDTLTCRLSRLEPQEMKKRDGFVILARDHSHIPTGSCTSSTCSFSQRCLKTRSGKSACVQDEKQNYPEKSPQHTVARQETFISNLLHEASGQGDLDRVGLILSQNSVDINSRDEKHGRTPLMLAAKEGHCEIFAFLINKGANTSEADNDCMTALHWACKGGHVSMVECVQNAFLNFSRMPPLIQAAKRGYTDVVEFLVCTGSNVSQVDGIGRNVLHYACSGGHMALAKYLVSQGSININSTCQDGQTPLMMAASTGYTSMFKFLVRMGADVSRVDDIGNNVLHLASRNGHMAIVQYLVSQGSVNINSRREDGRTPLMEAAFGGYTDVFKFLVRMGANVSCVDDIGNNVLHLASRNGHREMMEYLVSEGSVNINSTCQDGRTPLMMAATSGYTDICKFLVSMGADVSRVDDIGNNVLHLASRNGRMEMVQYLVLQGSVNINSTRKDGRTPLMETTIGGYTDICKFLVRMGANVSCVDDIGNNVLHLAIRQGHREMMEYLVSEGSVNINSTCQDGRTPLMMTASSGYTGMFKFLVGMGANVSCVDDIGNNVLHLASRNGRMAIVQYLDSQGSVNINSRREDGRTPLMEAAFGGCTSIFKFLVRMGANVSCVDDIGNNVLHLASRNGHMAIVQYLVLQGIVDINSTRKDGRTPLMQAASKSYTGVFKFLIRMGADVSPVDDTGRNILHFASRAGNWGMVKCLVSQGSVNIKSTRKDGQTPLMEAAFGGHTYIFKFLVRVGANVSRVDGIGNNVLHLASRNGRMEMVQYLVSQGIVDINSKREDGRTPLMEAALGGNRKVFDFLVNKGANVSCVDDNGDNILHLVSSCGCERMLTHILSKTLVDINARDKDGQTAAMIAMREGHYYVHKFLVSNGCPVK